MGARASGAFSDGGAHGVTGAAAPRARDWARECATHRYGAHDDAAARARGSARDGCRHHARGRISHARWQETAKRALVGTARILASGRGGGRVPHPVRGQSGHLSVTIVARIGCATRALAIASRDAYSSTLFAARARSDFRAGALTAVRHAPARADGLLAAHAQPHLRHRRLP